MIRESDAAVRAPLTGEEPYFKANKQNKWIVGISLGAIVALLAWCIVLTIVMPKGRNNIDNLNDRVDTLQDDVSVLKTDNQNFRASFDQVFRETHTLSELTKGLTTEFNGLKILVWKLLNGSVEVNSTLKVMEKDILNLEDLTYRQQMILTDLKAYVTDIHDSVEEFNKTIEEFPEEIKDLQDQAKKFEEELMKGKHELNKVRNDLDVSISLTRKNFTILSQGLSNLESALERNVKELTDLAFPEYKTFSTGGDTSVDLSFQHVGLRPLHYTILKEAKLEFTAERDGFAICDFSSYTDTECEDCQIYIAPFIDGAQAVHEQPDSPLIGDSHFGYTINFPFTKGSHTLTTGLALVGTGDGPLHLNMPGGLVAYCNFYGL